MGTVEQRGAAPSGGHWGGSSVLGMGHRLGFIGSVLRIPGGGRPWTPRAMSGLLLCACEVVSGSARILENRWIFVEASTARGEIHGEGFPPAKTAFSWGRNGVGRGWF
jgi:hypothetical protein